MGERDAMLDAATQFAIEGVKALILINGGAAAGLATFATSKTDSPFTIGDLVWAMELFAFGALAATVTLGLSYISQVYAYELDVTVDSPRSWKFNAIRLLAVTFSVESCLLFVCGVLTVGESVKV